MKKILVLMLAAALALSLVACGGGNNTQDSTSAKGSENTKEETLTLGEFAKEGDWSFTLESIKFGDAKTNERFGDDYLRCADAEYKAKCTYGSSKSFTTAEAGRIFLFFEGKLTYSGKSTAKSGDCGLDFSVNYGDDYTFETYEFAVSEDSLGLHGYSTNVTFEPMESGRPVRGYFEVPSRIADNLDDEIQFTITLEKKKYTYSFTVQEAFDADISPEKVMEMALIFGDDVGDNLVDWTENSFPYFIEMRSFFPKLSDDELKKVIVGKWSTVENSDDVGDTRERIFMDDGTGKKQKYRDDTEEEYETFYWFADGGLNYSSEPNSDIAEWSWSIYHASDDVLVGYGTDGNPRIIFIKN